MKHSSIQALFLAFCFSLLTFTACSKDKDSYKGELPLTDSILLGKWTFDSTSMEYPYQTMTFVKDPKTLKKTLIFSAMPEMPYVWILNGNTVEGQAIYPDSYYRQTIRMFIKGINYWIVEIPAEEEGEDPTYDTAAYYMDVNGLISETHIGRFDTMYGFSGRLWMDLSK